MKLLIDENRSVRVTAILRDAGREVVHVAAVGLDSTNDEVILRGAHRPSVPRLRSSDRLTPVPQAELVTTAIGRVESELAQGAIASVTPERIRLRTLPIATG